MVVILIILSILAYLNVKKENNYVIRFFLYLFVLYWFVSLIASTFSPFGLFRIHIYTYFLLVLGVFSFILGMHNSKGKGLTVAQSINNSTFINKKLNSLFSNKYLIIGYLLSAWFCLQFAQRALLVASLQGHAEMEEKNELIFQGNNLAENVYGFIVMPLFHISLLLLSYAILHFKQLSLKQKLLIILYSFFFVCYTIIAGGRSVFLVAALYFLVTYIATFPVNRLFKFSFKSYLIIILGILLIIGGITAMNNFRNDGELAISREDFVNNDDMTAGEMVGRYSEIPLALFDRAIENDYLGKYGGLKFGRATFAGLDSWVQWFFKHLGMNYDSTNKIVKDLQENYYPYAPNRTANYAYTGLLYHYLDFGILGVFLFPFLFGLYFRKIILNYCSRPRASLLLLIGIGFFMMMHSIFTCYFIKSWVVVYIIILLIISRFENSTKVSL